MPCERGDKGYCVTQEGRERGDTQLQRGTMTETKRERDRQEQHRAGEKDRERQAGAERTRYERENQTKRDRERDRGREKDGETEGHNQKTIESIKLDERLGENKTKQKDGQRVRETQGDKEMVGGREHKAERD